MKSPQITSRLRIVTSSLTKSLLLASSAVALSVSLSSAAVIGYWRFEDSPGFTSDSGGNGITLSTSPTAPSQVAIPSDFLNPIPQTGAANAKAASFEAATPSNFFAADNSYFNTIAANGTFTIEAMVNTTNTSNSKIIASQWRTSYRSWEFYTLSGGALALTISTDGAGGASLVTFNSGFSLAVGVDYYVAASFDLSDTATGVKFYFQDLTNGGPLQTATFGHSVSAIYDSSGPFAIGAINSTGSTFQSFWNGTIDEVRLSNAVLAQGELLAVPEPGGVALIGLGLAWGLFRWRKKPSLAGR